MFCGGSVTPIETAQIGQYAENVYFGKPCGLMDQAASISGGVIAIDFRDKENPVVEKIDADFHGHALCIVDSGADHAGLTPAYAAIRSEMEAVAAHFGKKVLREVSREMCIRDRKGGIQHLLDHRRFMRDSGNDVCGKVWIRQSFQYRRRA